MITTERLVLRPWREDDLDDLARMCGDPDVMADYPARQTRSEAADRLARYRKTFEVHGFTRWALVGRNNGKFIGYTGIQPVFTEHPLSHMSSNEPTVEIGWRLVRSAWGQGLASEAARASLDDGFSRMHFREVLSYTTPHNARSQAVMRRIGLVRTAERDFLDPSGTQYIVFAISRSGG